MNTTNKLLLIDGSSMLSTAYYGNLPRQIMIERDPEKQKLLFNKIMQTSDGIYTNAIYTMLRMLKRIMENQKPSHVLIAFDKSRNTFRRKMFNDYKAQRSATPEPLKQQFVLMESILQELGFAVEFDDDYEADDILGSAAHLYGNCKIKENGVMKHLLPVVALTKDKDYFQLIDDNVNLWFMCHDKDKADLLLSSYCSTYLGTEDPQEIRQMLNIPEKCVEFNVCTAADYLEVMPEQVPDLKGIQGDNSDNIPGVKGVSSAAIPLHQRYGTLENIYVAIDECAGDAKKEKELNEYWKTLGVKRNPINAFKANRAIALLSKDLATIRRDYKLKHSLEEMKFTLNEEAKVRIYEKLEFKSL